MNSWTSRPRSPIRAITLTSASQLRAIMPSSVLLPTPEPAKMPMRWPLPQVSRPSMARTPVASGRADRLAAERTRRPVGDARGARGIERALAVDRAGQTVDDAAEQLLADRHREAAAAGKDRRARPHAVGFGERHQDQAVIAKADDFGGDARGAGAGPLGVQVTDLAERQPAGPRPRCSGRRPGRRGPGSAGPRLRATSCRWPRDQASLEVSAARRRLSTSMTNVHSALPSCASLLSSWAST